MVLLISESHLELILFIILADLQQNLINDLPTTTNL